MVAKLYAALNSNEKSLGILKKKVSGKTGKMKNKWKINCKKKYEKNKKIIREVRQQ